MLKMEAEDTRSSFLRLSLLQNSEEWGLEVVWLEFSGIEIINEVLSCGYLNTYNILIHYNSNLATYLRHKNF